MAILVCQFSGKHCVAYQCTYRHLLDIQESVMLVLYAQCELQSMLERALDIAESNSDEMAARKISQWLWFVRVHDERRHVYVTDTEFMMLNSILQEF